MNDAEPLFEIVAEVDKSDPRVALLGACCWCGCGPPICYGAALFVTCTGPRPDTNADRMEATEDHVQMRDDFYTNE